MGFLLKFVILFDLNKLLDFVNTKSLGNLIESNEIASPSGGSRNFFQGVPQ